LKVHENWKKCLQEIPRYESLEVDCEQVKRCIEIARWCMENDRHKRPTIKDIVSQLDEIEMENCELDPPLQLAEVPLLNYRCYNIFPKKSPVFIVNTILLVHHMSLNFDYTCLLIFTLETL
jgi:hypothetical protein